VKDQKLLCVVLCCPLYKSGRCDLDWGLSSSLEFFSRYFSNLINLADDRFEQILTVKPDDDIFCTLVGLYWYFYLSTPTCTCLNKRPTFDLL